MLTNKKKEKKDFSIKFDFRSYFYEDTLARFGYNNFSKINWKSVISKVFDGWFIKVAFEIGNLKLLDINQVGYNFLFNKFLLIMNNNHF